MSKLQNKIAFITGGSSGIGKAIALEFAKEGAKVAITYNSKKDAALKVKQQIEEAGGTCEVFAFNLTDTTACYSIVDEVVKQMGGLDILVNSAGVLIRQKMLDVTEKDLDLILNVNLKGPYILMQQVGKYMAAKKSKGAIVNISSISADRASGTLSHYEAAKAGFSMLTKSAAYEFSALGIRVNSISPGLTETEINEHLREDQPKLWNARVKNIPLGFVGQGIDHAKAAVFLASDDAKWITGANLNIDGGQLTKF